MYSDVRDLFCQLLVCFLPEEYISENASRLKKLSFGKINMVNNLLEFCKSKIRFI
jgi:hypothetical protein